MRGLLAVVVALGGCASSIAPTAPTHVDATPLQVSASPIREEMAWDVFWQGFAIGRAELSVGATNRATFTTNRLARMLASARYELTANATHARERIVLRGDTTEHAVAITGARFAVDAQLGLVPGGAPLHTVTSALAAIRVWATPDATRAYAWIIVDGALYRLDLARPVRDKLDHIRTLRVDGVIRPLDPAGARVDLQLWLAERDDRSPLRFVVETGGERVVAQLAETSLTAR